jgi:hypothetical protein
LIHHRRNHWKGWDCNIGIEKINVESSGYLIRGSHCGEENSNFGHITKPEFIKFPTQSTVCRWDWCPCGSDIATTKSKRHIR